MTVKDLFNLIEKENAETMNKLASAEDKPDEEMIKKAALEEMEELGAAFGAAMGQAFLEKLAAAEVPVAPAAPVAPAPVAPAPASQVPQVPNVPVEGNPPESPAAQETGADASKIAPQQLPTQPLAAQVNPSALTLQQLRAMTPSQIVELIKGMDGAQLQQLVSDPEIAFYIEDSLKQAAQSMGGDVQKLLEMVQ